MPDKTNWENLSAYLDGELDGAPKAALEKALEADADLREQLERLRSASGFFRKHGEMTLPPRVRARVLERLENDRPFWQRAWIRPAAGFAFAAAAVTILLRSGPLPEYGRDAGLASARFETDAALEESEVAPAEPASSPEQGRSVGKKEIPKEVLRTVEDSFEKKTAAGAAENLSAVKTNANFKGVSAKQKSLTEMIFEQEKAREERPVALASKDLSRGFGGNIAAPTEVSESARMFEVPQLAGRSFAPASAPRRSRVVGARATTVGLGAGNRPAPLQSLSRPAPTSSLKIEANPQVFRESEPWEAFWAGRRIAPPEVDFSRFMVVVLIPIERIDPRLIEMLDPVQRADHISMPYRFLPPTADNIIKTRGLSPYPMKLLPRSDLEIRAEQVP